MIHTAALDTLKPADITIVKSMKNPPAGVKLVMAAVCVMKDIKPEKITDPSGTGGRVNILFRPKIVWFFSVNIDRQYNLLVKYF